MIYTPNYQTVFCDGNQCVNGKHYIDVNGPPQPDDKVRSTIAGRVTHEKHVGGWRAFVIDGTTFDACSDQCEQAVRRKAAEEAVQKAIQEEEERSKAAKRALQLEAAKKYGVKTQSGGGAA